MSGPTARMLDAGRLHLQHGPIDLVIGCDGPAQRAAFRAAEVRFRTILQQLVDELPDLRLPVGAAVVRGTVAQRMTRAVQRVAGRDFATPMAAVAGAVADEVLAAMRGVGTLRRAYVNNGGDIALHLGAGQRFKVALTGLDGLQIGAVSVTCDHKVSGIATSGRGGRSLTRGIADSVTVLAENAAIADAAATLIANATDLPGHPAVRRQRAEAVDPDSDLGARPVVTAVAPLSVGDQRRALDAGLFRARVLINDGAIRGAALFLQGESRVAGLSAVSAEQNERRTYA